MSCLYVIRWRTFVRNWIQSLVVVALSVNLVFASPLPIGVAKASGQFRLDNASVRSNITIFDGSTVESGASRSELVLNTGTRVMLTPNSRGKVFSDRTLLERGVSELTGSGTYRIEALNLKVLPQSANSVAQVGVNTSNHLVVTAKGGPVDVRNATGVLVAMVMPGNAMEFDPQAAGASTATKISGVLIKKDGKFLLRDSTTNVTFEVQGSDVEKYVGKNVEVVGATISGVAPAAGASQVVNASSVTPSGGGKKKAAAVAGAAAGGAAAGTIAGLSTVVFVSVVGGVAAAATVGGLYGSGAIGGTNTSASHP